MSEIRALASRETLRLVLSPSIPSSRPSVQVFKQALRSKDFAVRDELFRDDHDHTLLHCNRGVRNRHLMIKPIPMRQITILLISGCFKCKVVRSVTSQKGLLPS